MIQQQNIIGEPTCRVASLFLDAERMILYIRNESMTAYSFRAQASGFILGWDGIHPEWPGLKICGPQGVVPRKRCTVTL